ncbi:T9SS type A sorting domain-containing protein [Urechidicola croceus]|uniref:Secretion system C-terminal sorting domain-containing protein n=1 Tax=Urechidicola croceus TaxID=1850246 RepID=A0A1D8P951_9FLAO|nr:T9SS type A sorting domain-containing protein [Urechidicola croceus]AOW21101.1 hypothetical protein LPB138_10610 [Urechidicola croceus]
MDKKLLILFLFIFSIHCINAQDNVVHRANWCVAQENGGQELYSYEFGYDGLVNGKYSYKRIPANTAYGNSLEPPAQNNGTEDDSLGIAFDGTQWVFYQNSSITDILYTQNTHTTGVFPPDSGWVSDGVPCTNPDTTMVLLGNEVVLSTEKYALNNKEITIFPNPSSDYIEISNLSENVKCTISNITGQVVKNTTVSESSNRINISDLAKGFYILDLEGKKTIKLVKK